MTNLSKQIEKDFIEMLDKYHSLPEIWDNEADAMIASWYANPPRVFPKRDHPYFSPSGATMCPRALYHKAKRDPKDVEVKQPHQTRWAGIGTVIGDYLQSELIKIERNYEKHVGERPRFMFEYTKDERPMFEEFAKTNFIVHHGGESFYIYGQPDGVMTYLTDDGELVRVGLEIKSKQQSPSHTSVKSMKGPQDSHVAQTALYADMYDADYQLIVYVNGAKRAWDMDKEEYESFPDVRAFCRKVERAEQEEIYDKFAEITRCIKADKPPMPDLDEWKFNPYKQTIAKTLTDDEFEELKQIVTKCLRSGLPQYVKKNYHDAYEYIKSVREES